MDLCIGFIHFNVQYKKGEENKYNLLKNIQKAAINGAKIILTPEMAVSGYSFQDREDISQFVEDEDGKFIKELALLAEQFGCYICIGLALRQSSTAAYCNSAIVLGPDGFVFRYDKINGEIRWARPGDPKQINSFLTPWGKVGVLICSDTYYDLQPRISALRGIDLLLVPANWPPTGLDPVELWQARAEENGFAIAACNRTGKDLNMSCELAESCLIDSMGKVIFRQQSATTQIFSHALPLAEGKLSSVQRRRQLEGRRVNTYHSCYRNINILKDSTSFYNLPPSGELRIHCVVGEKHTIDEVLTSLLEEIPHNPETMEQQNSSLWLCLVGESIKGHEREFAKLAREKQIWLCLEERNAQPLFHLFSPRESITLGPLEDHTPPPHLDIGPARVAFMDFATLRHPENAVVASKEGCDLIIVGNISFDESARRTCGVRTINHLCITLCSEAGAGIWMRPEGHARWGEVIQSGKGICRFTLDTHYTRRKRFQDRLDFDQLLTPTTIK